MKIAVVGGGAAGMMAAIAAAQAGARVTLLEKNEKLGKKVYITGKGRCNVTTACEPQDFYVKVITNPRFLYSSFAAFNNKDMQEFLASEGLRLKTERGLRVFPESDKASDVTRTLSEKMNSLHVSVRLNTEVLEIHQNGRLHTEVSDIQQNNCLNTEVLEVHQNDRLNTEAMDIHQTAEVTPSFTLLLRDTRGTREETFDKVIVATGGKSYPSTGSTGDGYRFAEGFGLKVETPIPSLVPFVAKEEWVRELMGLSLRNVEVTIKDGKKKLFTEFGEMLFTHFGVSGPAVLSASGVCAKAIRKNPLTLTIDLKPALTEEQLDKRMVREWKENSRKQFKNALGSFLPATLVPVMVRLSGISPEKEVSSISKKERQNLIALMKGFSLTLTGVRDFAEAIVTQGGVSVKEIAPKTMECKKVPGLYFAGEVLDVDACTGGYNLQIAWSTGHAAGKAAAEETQRI